MSESIKHVSDKELAEYRERLKQLAVAIDEIAKLQQDGLYQRTTQGATTENWEEWYLVSDLRDALRFLLPFDPSYRVKKK